MTPQQPEIRGIRVHLSGSPLLAPTLTPAAWRLGSLADEKSGRNPLVSPVAIAVAAVAATIVAIDMPYATCFEGEQFVHFLLGTATVSLAVSIATALATARLLGVDAPLQQGLWAKSVTAPIAVGVAERIGASPTLTAVYAVVNGVLGAVPIPLAFGR
jgi:putative effector of murein hydrolase